MARCKSSPEVVRTKCELANRLKEIRTEQYGDRGGPELARRLNLPIRTWYNYETGVTVPSEVLLRFIELTDVEPRWLLHGEGTKLRRSRPLISDRPSETGRAGSVGDLLRQVLNMLETRSDGGFAPNPLLPRGIELDQQADQVLVHVEDLEESETDGHETFKTLPMKREWLDKSRNFHCLKVKGTAMMPILADGAVVGIAERPESAEVLNGALVAARIEGRVLIRWLQVAGHVVLLRAENPAFEPEIVPTRTADEDPGVKTIPFRRVLWSCTPHVAPVS
ncbi:helix-turn-helix domain-containing protein [Tautonia rosea]|uniref:helix-turn-helix domain-containing protein n=1 Tax=Tautonia rosea TaxID=2728037 RepID=UPI0014737C7D|nr:XRE family transcriptional regulator [Tautonia rosea]